jgi:predicted nuclease of restriction endonuclease-like RecB superfamily
MGVELCLRVFENSVTRKIYGWKMEEVTGDWRKLYNVEFLNVIPHFCYPDYKIEKMKWTVYVAGTAANETREKDTTWKN